MVILYILVVLLSIAVILLAMALYMFAKKSIYLSDKEKDFIIFVMDIFKDYGDDLGIQSKDQHKELVDELDKIKTNKLKHGNEKINVITDYYPDSDFLQADGFDEAIIGVVFDKVTATTRLAYYIFKCIRILVGRDNMTEEEAIEYFDFNVQGAYMGENTPIWVDDEILFDIK